MRQLLIYRHAKAVSPSVSKTDYGRALAPRGIKAALRMGHWIANQEFLPDRILCSSAKRTRQTMKLSTELWEEPVDKIQLKELYLASSAELRAQITAHGKNAKRLMIVAHNPGVHELTVNLVRDKASDTSEAIGKFPTGAIAVLDCDIKDWGQIGKNCARLTTFIRPRALG